MPRDLFGVISSFEASLKLLRVFPRWFVDKILVFCSRLTLGCTDEYNLVRPAEGPLEMKERTGRTPVLDVGTVAKIRRGEIKVKLDSIIRM
jgi:indole-3-pyruvate monooxygenase